MNDFYYTFIAEKSQFMFGKNNEGAFLFQWIHYFKQQTIIAIMNWNLRWRYLLLIEKLLYAKNVVLCCMPKVSNPENTLQGGHFNFRFAPTEV